MQCVSATIDSAHLLGYMCHNAKLHHHQNVRSCTHIYVIPHISWHFILKHMLLMFMPSSQPLCYIYFLFLFLNVGGLVMIIT
jgi:hypothetical protein